MHSRPRVPKDQEKEKLKLTKALAFQKAFQSILKQRSDGVTSKEMLDPCDQLLYKCPELYTLWNYRREILLHCKEKMLADEKLEKEFDQICSHELDFTEQCLQVNPKAYQTWHHRAWLLNFIPAPDLKKELELCTLFLKKDERNFHGWDHRRYVAELAAVDIHSELAFADQKLKENFSNFSAWHLQGSLLTKLAREADGDLAKTQELLNNDFETVQEAIFTDPNDQSIWFYFRWLLNVYSKSVEWLAKIDRPKAAQRKFVRFTCNWTKDNPLGLMSIELDSPRAFQPNQLSVSINHQPTECTQPWRCNILNGSFIFWTFFKRNDAPSSGDIVISLDYPPDTSLFPGNIHFQTSDLGIFIFDNEESLETSKFDPSRLNMLKELLEIEPDNKWLNFTMALMDTNSAVEKLIQIDPLRVNYYHDLKSKTVSRQAVSKARAQRTPQVNMSGLQLYSVRYLNELSHITHLDLSNNRLIQFGQTFAPLVNVQVLILDSNRISQFDDKLSLPRLSVLSLVNNKIESLASIDSIVKTLSPSLKHLIVWGNPVVDKMTANNDNNTYGVKIYWNDKIETERKVVENLLKKSSDEIVYVGSINLLF